MSSGRGVAVLKTRLRVGLDKLVVLMIRGRGREGAVKAIRRQRSPLLRALAAIRGPSNMQRG